MVSRLPLPISWRMSVPLAVPATVLAMRLAVGKPAYTPTSFVSLSLIRSAHPLVLPLISLRAVAQCDFTLLLAFASR